MSISIFIHCHSSNINASSNGSEEIRDMNCGILIQVHSFWMDRAVSAYPPYPQDVNPFTFWACICLTNHGPGLDGLMSMKVANRNISVTVTSTNSAAVIVLKQLWVEQIYLMWCAVLDNYLYAKKDASRRGTSFYLFRDREVLIVLVKMSQFLLAFLISGGCSQDSSFSNMMTPTALRLLMFYMLLYISPWSSSTIPAPGIFCKRQMPYLDLFTCDRWGVGYGFSVDWLQVFYLRLSVHKVQWSTSGISVFYRRFKRLRIRDKKCLYVL